MVTVESVNLDALVARYLLPSAADELVGEVRAYLEGADLGKMPALSSQTEGAGNGHSTGPLPEFSPWQLLHVTRSAPSGVVEVAYRFWRRSHAPAPGAAANAPAPEVPWPAPPVSGRTPARESHADADDRMSALGVGGGGAPPVKRWSSGTSAAFIESVSGEHRFGIGSAPLRIGVDPGCDVRLPDSGVKVDVRIWLHGERYMLHVAAGVVLVNGASASWAVLDDDDILEIGHAKFRFRREDT